MHGHLFAVLVRAGDDELWSVYALCEDERDVWIVFDEQKPASEMWRLERWCIPANKKCIADDSMDDWW